MFLIVTDPLKFAQTLSGSVSNAEGRIDAIVYNATKNTISNMNRLLIVIRQIQLFHFHSHQLNTVLIKELLIYDLPASDVITSDKKTMIVDSYVLWHVTDPLKFAQTLSCSVNCSICVWTQAQICL